jgi:hypothetical protein
MPRFERDDIMLWVNNESSFYDDLHGLYDKWVEEGDAWSEKSARREAEALIKHIAEAIDASQRHPMPYTKREISAAVDEVIEDFDDYRDEAIAEAVDNVKRQPRPEDMLMDAGDKEHAKKTEEMLQKMIKLGRYDIEMIRGYMPVSPQKVRQALERGDKYLNTIPLRKWDEQAKMLGRPWVGFSLADGVSILKHVAKWHYA